MTDAGPRGNVYDKYGSTNPLYRRLMARFESDLDGLLRSVMPATVLDVGCGEGEVTARWASALPGATFVGLDLEDPGLAAQWAARSQGNLAFISGNAAKLPFEEGAFDLVSGIEMLEHVPEPDAVLAEMARVASRYLLVSVPREPVWRALNVVRGSYLGEWGNTPGHVNHWSKRDFVRLVGGVGTVEAVRSPLPWTVALVRLD